MATIMPFGWALQNRKIFINPLSTKECGGMHKARLLIGEGNFSYALALIKKHDERAKHSLENSLGRAITATELDIRIHCKMCEFLKESYDCSYQHYLGESYEVIPIYQPGELPQEIYTCDQCTPIIEERENNIKELLRRKVTILFGIDATKIHEEFKDRHFTRIHWNCPHDGNKYQEQTLPELVANFFISCSKIQKEKDRIHVTLAQPLGRKVGGWKILGGREYYQGYVYNIVQAAFQVGYTLIKKNRFNNRYRSYKHMQTRDSGSLDKKMNEFVFQKVSDKQRFQAHMAFVMTREPMAFVMKLQEFSPKVFFVQNDIFHGQNRMYLSCESDNDSSDYEEDLD